MSTNNYKPQDLKHQRILVTGASGFHGSWLTQHLLDQGAFVTTILAGWNPESYFVTGGAIERVKCEVGQIENYDWVERVVIENKIDAVFHLASLAIKETTSPSPLGAFDLNIRGTYNILKACRRSGKVKRVVVASSDKVYGDSPALPYTEDMPLLEIDPYDVSMVCQDLLAQNFYHSYGLPVIIGRFGNIYGGGDLAWSRLIPGAIYQLLNEEPPLIWATKEGRSFRRDFLYVKDLVEACMAMFWGLDDPRTHGQAFNFATGSSWTVMEIIRKLQGLLGREAIQPHIVLEEHTEILAPQMSFDKAQQMLHWSPRFSLDQGLQETVDWYRDFFARRPHYINPSIYYMKLPVAA